MVGIWIVIVFILIAVAFQGVYHRFGFCKEFIESNHDHVFKCVTNQFERLALIIRGKFTLRVSSDDQTAWGEDFKGTVRVGNQAVIVRYKI